MRAVSKAPSPADFKAADFKAAGFKAAGFEAQGFEAEQDGYKTLLQYPAKKRDAAHAKVKLIKDYDAYKKSKRIESAKDAAEGAKTNIKRDTLQDYLNAHEAATGKTVTKRQFYYMSSLYNKKGPAALVDTRGGYNKGKSAITDEVKEKFLSLIMQEKGTKKGNPAIAAVYDALTLYYANADADLILPPVSHFVRLWSSIPQIQKDYYCKSKKYFDDNHQPHIPFDYTSISSNQEWVGDTHTFDVLVKYPNGKIGRPAIVGWEDRRSRLITGYKIIANTSSNGDDVLDSLRDAMEKCGVPDSIKRDNGKDYSAQDLLNIDNCYSLANEMNMGITKAIKYNAKAKHIERAFKTIEEHYCVLWQAYIGNNTQTRPEEFKKTNKKLEDNDKIMDFKEFERVMKGAISHYNNTRAHNGHGMNNQTPAAVYEACLIEKRVISKELLSLYMTRKTIPLKVGRNGINVTQLNLHFNSNELAQYHGQRVVARYGTDDAKEVRIFDENGVFVCIAAAVELGTMDKDVTVQQIREINAIKKHNRDFAKKLNISAPIVSIENLYKQIATNTDPPPLQGDMPTTIMVDPIKQQQAQEIQAAQEKRRKKKAPTKDERNIKKAEDEAYFDFLIG